MLPKQNLTVYELTVPSTNKKVKYRPFTVREEKLLMIAQNSGKIQDMVDTLKGVISACTNEKLDVDSLAVFDLEYIMATLRTKSVGETSRLEFECDKDPTHEKVLLDIDLSKIEVIKNPEHITTIPLFDNVGVKMRYPDISMMDVLVEIENDPNLVFGIIYDCIEYIYDDKEVFQASEQTQTELVEFIDGLTKEQFGKLEKFFTTMPTFSHTIEYKCPTCGEPHKKKIEGFENFF